jgi:hypothetical protein
VAHLRPFYCNLRKAEDDDEEDEPGTTKEDCIFGLKLFYRLLVMTAILSCGAIFFYFLWQCECTPPSFSLLFFPAFMERLTDTDTPC